MPIWSHGGKNAECGTRSADKTRVRAKLSLESSGGGGASPAVNVTEPNPVIAAPPAVVEMRSAERGVRNPPAAETVIHGEVTEETLKLKQELAAERAARKKVEEQHASVTDEFTRYKDATEARAIPIPIRKRAPDAKPFRIGRFV